MPRKYCAANERIKRRYLQYLRAAGRLSEPSIDKAAAAIERFDAWNRYKDFHKFHFEQAIAFRTALERETHPKTGKPLGKSTLEGIFRPLRSFMLWLADQPGYRSKIRYSDAELFCLSRRDQLLARAGEPRPSPSVEQIRHVLRTMPGETVIERRNRAIVAFLILTGIRDGAMVGLRLRHLDLHGRRVHQDARQIRTKFAKTMTTIFFPVCPEAEAIVHAWADELTANLLHGPDDALFPKTKVGLGPGGGFVTLGVERASWRSPASIRRIVAGAFSQAGLPAFGPHSFRHTLMREAKQHCKSLEEFEAYSENIGHNDPKTTLRSYGGLSLERRAVLLQDTANVGKFDGVPGAGGP